MSKLFQIKEDDLAELERVLPQICDRAIWSDAPAPDTGAESTSVRLRMQIRKVQEILSMVRWDYGPPSEIGTVSGEPE